MMSSPGRTVPLSNSNPSTVPDATDGTSSLAGCGLAVITTSYSDFYMTLRCYHTQASFLLIIRYRPGDDTGLHFKDRRGKVPTLWLILWRATEAHRSTQHRRPACGARTYLSLQTSTLLGVKNLKAICGGCVLTCPGWAVWRGRPAEEEAHTPHSRPTKRFSAAWLHGSEEPPTTTPHPLVCSSTG